MLVGVEFTRTAPAFNSGEWPVEESLIELGQLARSAGLIPVGQAVQRRERPHPATYIGPGKLDEVVEIVNDLAADVVLFDEELSPRHQRELERVLGDEVKLLDRTALILDVFAQHARTREGALQVELAQYEYRLPRLTRAWTHLARQAGGRAGGALGGVGLRGPGETQLETDRRVISRRINKLKRDLDGVRAHRARYRARRRKAGSPTIAIVGYTNAGKSTLLNAVSGADAYVADQLFATLDPITRRVRLPGGSWALLTDTVGFIQRLPAELVAAFRATLEEVTEADLLLHVVDATHPRALDQSQAVVRTLDGLGAGDKAMVTALNKVDRLPSRQIPISLERVFPGAVRVSALTGEGLGTLMARLEQALQAQMTRVDVTIPYEQGELVGAIRVAGTVEHELDVPGGTRVVGWLPRAVAGRVLARVMSRETEGETATG